MKTNYTFWHRGMDSSDLEWLSSAISRLETDEWEKSSPIYIDGGNWAKSQFHEEAAIMLLNALKSNSSATKLILQNADLSSKAEAAFTKVLEKNLSLTSLVLRNTKCCCGKNALPSSSLLSLSSLQQLKLVNCCLTQADCLLLSKLIEMESISSLTLCNLQFKDGGSFDPIMNSLVTNQTLESLEVIDVDMTNENICKLFEDGNISHLRSLALERMDLNSQHVEQLRALIERNKNLMQLSLRGNNLCGRSVHAVSEALLRNSTLESLLLCCNPFGDAGARMLVDALKINKSLRKLYICDCRIGREGCEYIAVGLVDFVGLEILDVSCNAMDNFFPTILDSIKRNMFMKHIMGIPSSTSSTSSAVHLIERYLRLNRVGRRFVKDSCELQPALLPLIYERANCDRDALYYFLKHSPPSTILNKIF